ncbi:MAG: glycosyltransferase [Hymenobacter sp.]|nr:MAG: glycosyltransferase [Hymenobacter sp.]
MSSPLITVGVASYNNAAYLPETLNSIRNQTYANIELLIVDDCSPDNSAEVASEWLAQNPTVNGRLIRHEKNMGVCRTCNDFITYGNGEYLSLIGSDDIMLPEKLTIQAEILVNSPAKVGIVYSDAHVIDAAGRRHFSRFIQKHRQFVEIPQGDIFPILLEDNFMPVMTALIRKECFANCGAFDETLMYEDWDILLRIARKYEFVYSDYVAAEYRIHATNATKRLRTLPALETNFKLLSKHLGINAEYDAVIKGKLRHLLDYMYSLKSPRLREHMEQYNAYFNEEGLLKFALKSGLPYFRLLRLQRLLGRFTK